ncbi:MAG TPA: hypothetical protein VK338_02875 [Candidatus Nitrosocosmicus sp.]|nr:hypothetical protein [Candidatus Nitrosocosmicus sp.]
MYNSLEATSRRNGNRVTFATEAHTENELKRIRNAFRQYNAGLNYFHDLVVKGKFRMALKGYKSAYKILAEDIQLRNAEMATQISQLANDPQYSAVVANLGHLHIGICHELGKLGYEAATSVLGRLTEEMLTPNGGSNIGLIVGLTTTSDEISLLDWNKAMISEVLFNTIREYFNLTNDIDADSFHRAREFANSRVANLSLEDLQSIEEKIRQAPGKNRKESFLQAFGVPLNAF